MQQNENPFTILSQIFIDNQRFLNDKTNGLRTRLKSLITKLNELDKQLENDLFSTDLNIILNIEEESKLILAFAKEVEFQRDQITNAISVLSESKKIKLNK